jgi:flagellar biosynthetic protein FliR
MAELIELYRNQLLVFLLVLARVGGFVAVAPVGGGLVAAYQVRLLLAVALAVLIAPLHWHEAPACGAEQTALLLAVAREAILGVVLGVGLLLLVGAMQAGGQIIAQMSGLSLAQLFDAAEPTGITLLGRLLEHVAIATFLLLGGHRQVLAAWLDTFQWLPPGMAGVSSDLFATCSDITRQAFVLAIRVAAPAVAALLLATLSLGMLSRVAPQLNAWTIGLNVNVIVAIAMTSLCLGGAAWMFQEQTLAAVEAIRATLEHGGP